MREQEVVTLAVVAVAAADIRAGVWQFPVASSHLAEVQMRKHNDNKKTPGCGCSQEVGRELGVCQVKQPQFSPCPPPLRPEAKVNLTPVTLPMLPHAHGALTTRVLELPQLCFAQD